MNKMLVFAIVLNATVAVSAQNNDLIERYRRGQENIIKQYEEERESTIQEYIESVKNAWEWYKTLPAIPRPQRQNTPPVIMDEEEKQKPYDNYEIKIDDVIIPPQPEPEPEPIVQIDDAPSPNISEYEFDYFGTLLKVRFKENQKINLSSLNRESIANALTKLSIPEYEITLQDCLQLRSDMHLCDWAYYKLLDILCDSIFGNDTNESELVKSYLYMKSGYAMRLCISEGNLIMLYGTQHQVYERPGLTLDNINFYPEYDLAANIQLCQVSFPYTHTMSLSISVLPLLSQTFTMDRQLKMPGEFSIVVNSNKNLLDFLETYPTSRIGDNDVSRWALYANTPMSGEMTQQLYPKLKKLIEDKPLNEAVNVLCSWIQKSFDYEYDNKVWGHDRAFFADESLYYPYCDCEDRSILLTRIARDLLDVNCLLVFYPGHLATAIAVGNDIPGDYISIEGKKYIICDPTYIGAPIGRTMPNMNNTSAKVIKL